MSSYKQTEISNKITIADYEKWVRQKNKIEIADFVYKRLYERYIRPFEGMKVDHKHGFLIMASACLLIETYESHREGWDETKSTGRITFKSFFERESTLNEFKNHSEDFYINVRCGILHQGETKNGWKIKRNSDYPLFSINKKTINANTFIFRLKKVLSHYKSELKEAEWDADIWQNLRTKLNHIIDNCKRNG